MYQRYYDGYNFVGTSNVTNTCSSEGSNIVSSNCSECSANANVPKQSFLESDDILLIGVLIVLLHEECNDKALILIIGFLLISGFVNI